MPKLNTSRLILSGLLAGLVCNIFDGVLNAVILASQWSSVQQALGRPEQFSVNQVVLFNLLGFAAGILAMWIYAAIQPRFESGIPTAIRAGLVTWGLFNLLPNLFLIVTGFLPASLMGPVICVGIIEYPLAVMAGSVVYKQAQVQKTAAASV